MFIVYWMKHAVSGIKKRLCERQSLISSRVIKPLFFFDPFANPYRHELGVGNAVTQRHTPYRG